MLNILSVFFSLRGKISRSQFWISMTSIFCALLILGNSNFGFLLPILLISFFAIQIKRARDIGWPVWLSVLSLFPFIQIIWIVVIGAKKGRIKENSSGASKERSDTKQEKQENEKPNFKEKPKEIIISCPSCQHKSRMFLPVSENNLQCSICAAIFRIHIDINENIYFNLIVAGKKLEESNTNTNTNTNTVEYSFKILEISKNSNPKEIKYAYRKKIIKYHPDKVDHLGNKLKKVAEEETVRLNKAYSILKENGYV